ncbi:Concanavalin A-like lectin/glucanase subgroup [Penicillium angulare]|uniref:Concanavalin A-like lectin/glucanase subgroup n=1 Tax=Penicillium angulare TaxID=116970 RepID=UPI002541050B|nr:Concanavalin A-like lectin/glucanase subgroup [Penicillium angulare]KAJ5263162.1 Concanavalin A-like lectin/glucanase subgroup [Penicillium angulare]
MSTDLESWTHIGNAINRRSQVSLVGASTFIAPWDDGTAMVATGGLYAPTIRHHKNTTYIICTNVIHGSTNEPGDEHSEQFIIYTKDIQSGNWSDPIVFSFPGIDPSLFFDDEDKVYVQICKTGPEFHIYNMELDIKTGKVLTEPSLIWRGWARGYTEGPHLYKKDGWYYLLCAEGGTFRHHMMSMARSKQLSGPYEPYEKNPLYSSHGSDRYVQNTGHGDLFQDQKGHWWMVFLGCRIWKSRSIMGRETFLTRVDWKENEWPAIDCATIECHRGLLSATPVGVNSTTPWVYLRDAKIDRYDIQGNIIKIKSDSVELTSPNESVTFLGQRQRRLEGTASVTIVRPQMRTSVRAGLALYKDEHRYLAVMVNFLEGNIVFEGINWAKNFSQTETQSTTIGDSVSLKIDYTELSLQLSFKPAEGEWYSFGAVDTSVLTDFDFTGPVIGIFAIGADVDVEFENFEVDSTT